ncbi:MAG: hypothetical protein J6Y92_02145 [Lentisphaeria bacterium]|nr:hypothetical protein [Lentisphaeria bacterium]
MKNTTWVFGSMLAAGCMLLSVPVAAQGNFPQGMPQGNFPQGNFPQGMQGMPQGNFPQGMPQGMGAGPGFQQGGAAQGRTGQTGAKPATTDKTNTTAKTNAARSDKAALEAAKYQLSNHRTDIIRTTIDGYASSEDLTEPSVVRSINADIEKHMPLVPSVPLENADLQALNEQAKKLVEQDYGSDDKKYQSIVETRAAEEIPLYKVGDKVSVDYNMGPKHYSVKGTLYRVTEKSITVEDKIINFIDLNDETRAKFDPQKNKYMRSQYVKKNLERIAREKDEKIRANYDKLKGEVFKRNETAGYIYDPLTGAWATAQELAKNYIDLLAKDKSRQPKPKTTTAQVRNDDGFDDFPEDDGQDSTPAVNPGAGKTTPGSSQATIIPVNDAIKLEDNAESLARYEAVIAKAESQQKNANENYAGIDADCGYKKACWGFTIADARYALWREPEFPHIEPALGRDVITFPPEGLDVGIAGDPDSIDLVYVSNSLSKVIYMMKDCSRQDFLRFKDSLTEQYGHAAEDKGGNSVAFTNIFTGKTPPQQIADADEIEAAQAAVKDAEKAFNKAVAELKNANDDNRDELQEARDNAASALKAANAKAETFENAVSSDNLPYVYSRVKLAKDNAGKVLLPYTFSWKGQNVSGTLIFYYDKAKDKVTSLVFAKEYKK